jgi:hypothetical protein
MSIMFSTTDDRTGEYSRALKSPVAILVANSL